MRIAYLSTSTVPSRQANSIHVMQMCNAFARLGHEVTLFCRRGAAESAESIRRFYDVGDGFELVHNSWPQIPGGGIAYGMRVFQGLKKRMRSVDLLYARCLYSACLAKSLGIPLIYESHALPRTWFHRRLQSSVLSSRQLRGFVLISRALQTDYESSFPALSGRLPVLIAPDAAVSPPPLADTQSSCERADEAGPIQVAYTGSLLPGKGIEVVIALARRCPQCHFHIFGGSPRDWEKYRKRATSGNLFYHGFVPPAEMRQRQRNADILLLPNQNEILSDKGRVDIGRWTSPLKMFEYMASGVPLIASDLPVLKEVLVSEHNSLLVPPQDIEAWARSIQRLVADSELRRRLATNAYAAIVERYNWTARARMVLGCPEVPQSDV